MTATGTLVTLFFADIMIKEVSKPMICVVLVVVGHGLNKRLKIVRIQTTELKILGDMTAHGMKTILIGAVGSMTAIFHHNKCVVLVVAV